MIEKYADGGDFSTKCVYELILPQDIRFLAGRAKTVEVTKRVVNAYCE